MEILARSRTWTPPVLQSLCVWSSIAARIISVLTLDRVFRVVPALAQAIDSDVEGLHVEYAFCGDDGTAKVPVDFARAAFTA